MVLQNSSGTVFSRFYVDGQLLATTPPYSVTWDSTKVANGSHTLSATAYSSNRFVIGTQTIAVTVQNQILPTATPTPTPAPTSSLKLSSPISGAQVSGNITIAANQPSNVSWENFYVDGNWIQSSPPFSFSWSTGQIANGAHTISVIGYSSSGSAVGADSRSITVANAGTSPQGSTLPTPTIVPTVAPTKVPTIAPTVVPTIAPTSVPTIAPTRIPTVVPTVVPTSVPTAVPTVAPTKVPTIVPTAVPTLAPTTTATTAPTAAPTNSPSATPTPATTADFFVSPSGNDGNNGSSPSLAWLTIQHAVNTMHSGDVVSVAQGTYNERVNISRDGITIEADPNATAKPIVAQGFEIQADNVVVNGFEISFRNKSDPAGTGVYIHDASNVTLENSYIHDLCHAGVMMESTVGNVQVLNNLIVHAQEVGINIDGNGDLVEGNEIWGTYQHPGVLGGIFATCTNDGSGPDADIIRFFGTNHVIRGNYGHDIEFDFGNSALPNPDPHTDCFQTWGASGENTSNILIDGNWCVWPSNGSKGTQDEVSSIEALDGPVSNITFQNNIFQDMLRGVNATRDGGLVIGQLNFYNNTFDHLVQEAIVVDGGARNDNIWNNIFYDFVGGDGFISYGSGESFIDNVFYNRAGKPSSGVWWGGAAAPPYTAVDPHFVNYGNTTGVGADYHLCVAGQNGCTVTSTIGHSGATIATVPTDFDGNSRTGGYSIGAEQMTP